MSGKSKTPDPSAEVAEKTSRRALIGVILTAVLGGVATISAATINSCGNALKLSISPSPTPSPFIGRIIDINTQVKIIGAKVSLESDSIPSVAYSDSEGIFSFPVNDPSKELRLRIQANEYHIYDLRITPAKTLGIQDIRLNPYKPLLPSPEPSGKVGKHEIAQKSSTIQKKAVSSKDAVSQIKGQVIDGETKEAIAGAIVGQDGYEKEAVATEKYGDFEITAHSINNGMILLVASKQGYRTNRLWHQPGRQSATISLFKNIK